MEQVPTFGFPEEWCSFAKRQAEFVKRLPNLARAVVLAFPTIELSETVDRIVYLLTRTCAEDFQEILLLCGNGYGIGAEKLLRGMYERAVTATYLHMHPEEARNFLDYDKVARHKLLVAVESTMGKNVLSPTQRETIEREFEEVKGRFMIDNCRQCKTVRLNHSWSKRDLVTMAGENDVLRQLVVPAYYMGVREGHSTMGSIFSRLDVNAAKKDEGLIFGGESQPQKADEALITSQQILLVALELQREHFKLDALDESLHLCQKDMFEIVQAWRHAEN